jgi:hypothetical protein
MSALQRSDVFAKRFRCTSRARSTTWGQACSEAIITPTAMGRS